MRRFAERFASFNVRIEQLQTCYAMAEAVFAVTQSQLGKAPTTVAVDRSAFTQEHRIVPARGDPSKASIEFVSAGAVLPGFEWRIIGPDRMDLPADRVGEIAIRG